MFFLLWEWEINPREKIQDPAGIRTQDLLSTSQMLLQLNHLDPWQRSGKQAGLSRIPTCLPLCLEASAKFQIVFRSSARGPSSLMVWVSHCALSRKDSLCTLACGFCITRKGGTEGGGWGHLQGDMHMVGARLGCERVIVGTGWATPRPECMDRLT